MPWGHHAMAKRRHRLHSAHVRECVLLSCVGGSTTGSGRGHERDGDGPHGERRSRAGCALGDNSVNKCISGPLRHEQIRASHPPVNTHGIILHTAAAEARGVFGAPRLAAGRRFWALRPPSIASCWSVASTSANLTLLGGNLVEWSTRSASAVRVSLPCGQYRPGNQPAPPPRHCGHHDSTQPHDARSDSSSFQ